MRTPAEKPPATKKVMTLPSSPESKKNRAQRRAAPPPDRLDEELKALQAQVQEQARLIKQHQQPKPKDPRQEQVMQLKQRLQEQSQQLQQLKGASQKETAKPPTTHSPAAPSKDGDNAKATQLADDVFESDAEGEADAKPIVMPDGTKVTLLTLYQGQDTSCSSILIECPFNR